MLGEESGLEHMAHESWHEILPYVGPAVAAVVGAVAIFCRKQIRSWYKKKEWKRWKRS